MGFDNSAVDALSWRAHNEELPSISTSTPKWLEVVIEGYTKGISKSLPNFIWQISCFANF
jgi:hypothetical protein